jgi:hypothetical protein
MAVGGSKVRADVGRPLVFHNGIALDAPMGCDRRVPPHGKLASIGIWLRANDSAP